MALISSIALQIVPNVPVVGTAQVDVTYTLTGTGDDVEAERRYHEVAQLFNEAQPVPGGTLMDDVVVFTASENYLDRHLPEMHIPLADLKQGVPPLQSASIVARVTLTPIPSRDSNVVVLNAPLPTA